MTPTFVLRFSRGMLVCAVLVGGAAAKAERLRTFDHVNYGGGSTLFNDAQPNLRGSESPAKIASARVVTGRWLLCAGANYAGDCAWIARDVASLPDLGFAEDTGSLRPEQVPVLMRHWGDKHPPSRQDLVLFAQANYDGAWVAVPDSVPDFSAAHIVTSVGSVIVNDGAWRACTGANFKGRCLILTGSAWDLQDIFGTQIDSLERIK